MVKAIKVTITFVNFNVLPRHFGCYWCFPTWRAHCSWWGLQAAQALRGGRAPCRRELAQWVSCIYCPSFGNLTFQDLPEKRWKWRRMVKVKIKVWVVFFYQCCDYHHTAGLPIKSPKLSHLREKNSVHMDGRLLAGSVTRKTLFSSDFRLSLRFLLLLSLLSFTLHLNAWRLQHAAQ